MKKYGLLGYPLTHSFSKQYFNEIFKKEDIDSSYENFEIDAISKFPGVIQNNPELIGLNVTIPYKEQVMPFLNSINDSAREVGAVNTIKISRSAGNIHLQGFNTDTHGFEFSLKPLLRPWHQKALILGTGGASKAVKYVLNKLNIAYLSASIEELKENEVAYEDIDASILREHLLIINATPLGTFPKTETFAPIPYKYIGEKHLLFDLVYNPAVTQFLAKGKSRGAAIKNGYEMLVGQAKKSYEIWNSEE